MSMSFPSVWFCYKSSMSIDTSSTSSKRSKNRLPAGQAWHEAVELAATMALQRPKGQARHASWSRTVVFFFPGIFRLGHLWGGTHPTCGWENLVGIFFLNPNKRKENKHTKNKHGTSVFKPRFLIAQLPRSPSGVCCSGRFNKPSPVGLAGAMIVKGLGVCAMSRTGPNWWPGVQIVNWLLVHWDRSVSAIRFLNSMRSPKIFMNRFLMYHLH